MIPQVAVSHVGGGALSFDWCPGGYGSMAVVLEEVCVVLPVASPVYSKVVVVTFFTLW